jgi:hypothetical protein
MAQPSNEPKNRAASEKTPPRSGGWGQTSARGGGWGQTVAFIDRPLERLSQADPKDVQQIAASQIELLAAYHQAVLVQSNRSFFWALIGSGFGLLLFAIAVGFSLVNGLSPTSIVPLIAGAVVNVVSGVVFVLYGKASSQLSAFHGRLEVLQRHLLANSIAESLSTTEERDRARTTLIGEISRGQPTTSE